MKALVVGVVALVAATLAGCGDDTSSSSGGGDGTRLEQALDNCDYVAGGGFGESDVISVADDGETLIIDGAKNDRDVEAVVCVFSELDTSTGLISKMDSTTALMGRQEEEEDDLSYEWTYHPDNGMDMVITEAE